MDYLKMAGAGAVAVGAFTTATALYLTRQAAPVPLVVDLDSQTVEVPGKDRARLSRLCKDGKPIEYLDPNVRTLYEAFLNGAKISNNGDSLGWKPSASEPYKWMKYLDVLSKAENVGSGFICKGLPAENTTRIGIFSQNRVEYVVTEQACYMYSMALVPLYDTLGEEACIHIVNQAEITLIVCDKNAKVKGILDRIDKTPCIKHIVVMEEISEELRSQAKAAKVDLVQFTDVEDLGAKNRKEKKPAKTDDLCMICYTSGTTGLPKGAMLTHKGVISTVVACYLQLHPAGITCGPEDIMISYLPLAHSYERLLEVYVYMNGGRVGFFQGDVRKLMDDIKELQPTLFPTVPRLLNRFYDKVMGGVNASPVKKFLFNMGMNAKEKEIKQSIIRNDSIWDKLVFKNVQQALGGRVRVITTGSAPLSPKVLSFLRCCVGCPILEGYGQTEDHAIATLQLVGDPLSGCVGPPLACNYIKLADVPDMKYFAAENKGELCIKGPNVFKGYLKDPEKTKEALDEGGWLHTGDIAEWLPNGTLKIIDRKKNIFKLAQGEYIAPEKIENVYVRSSYVAQVYVYGESLKSTLIGIVVPDPDLLIKLAKDKLSITGTLKDLMKNPEVKKAILSDMIDVGKKAGLKTFEQVKDIYVYPEMFSVENGLLTPTFKAKRQELKKYFAGQLEEMYQSQD